MIGSDVIRGYSDTILLSLLAEGDSYGYQLSRSIRERSGGAYQMKETTLYSALPGWKKTALSPPTRGPKARAAPAPTTPSPGRGGFTLRKSWRSGRSSGR